MASLLLPRRCGVTSRPSYAFARAADDFADEGPRAAAERHRLLDGWGARLNASVAAPAPGPPPRAG